MASLQQRTRVQRKVLLGSSDKQKGYHIMQNIKGKNLVQNQIKSDNKLARVLGRKLVVLT